MPHRLLLQGEDVVIEEGVQLLVRVVDAELLERVLAEVLEAEDVEHSEEDAAVLARVGARVDLVHQPGEGARVESLGHGVPVLPGL